MDRTSYLLLVNTASKEEHRLTQPECVIGRGWLQCVDGRISRKHGILKLTSNDSLSLISTHSNPIFFKTKNDEALKMINKNNEPIVLHPGDSFGLFPDTFWFNIARSDSPSEDRATASTDGLSATMASPDQSTSSNAVAKRKLPSWMNGNNDSKRTRRKDCDASGDGVPQVASADGSAEVSKRESPVLGDVSESNLMRVNETQETASSDGDDVHKDDKSVDPNSLESSMVDRTVPDASLREQDEPTTSRDTETVLSNGREAAVPNGSIGDADIADAGANVEPEASTTDNVDENHASDSASDVPNINATDRQAEEPAEGPGEELIDGVPMPNIVVKTEPPDDVEPNASNDAAVPGPSGVVTVKKEIKTEPDSSSDVKPPKRDCCPYGIKCYRQNPAHRIEMAHPGDIDYRLPNFGDPMPGAMPCPYGLRCYRRNPIHFRQFSHPPSTDPAANRKELRAKKMQNANKNDNDVGNDDDDMDDDDEDPFADDGDSDDPDFMADLSGEDDDEGYEESDKDSGHDTPDTPSDVD